jgi:SAM-dependent methyltransferase
MALSCPIGMNVKKLQEEVDAIYSRVAAAPDGEFHFHRGREYAVTFLGYDDAELGALPAEVVASFAGMGNPFALGRPPSGSTVLDIGSGAGTDALLAARHVGPGGRVVGVDPTDAMLQKARAAAVRAGAENIEFRKGTAEALPLETGGVDVAISNGVLNLATDKWQAFEEVRRVLRPGGRFQLADIVLASELSERIRNDIDLWTG